MIRLLGLFLVLVFIGGWVYLKNQNQDLNFNFIALLRETDLFYLGIAFATFILINFLRAFRFFFFNQSRKTSK